SPSPGNPMMQNGINTSPIPSGARRPSIPGMGPPNPMIMQQQQQQQQQQRGGPSMGMNQGGMPQYQQQQQQQQMYSQYQNPQQHQSQPQPVYDVAVSLSEFYVRFMVSGSAQVKSEAPVPLYPQLRALILHYLSSVRLTLKDARIVDDMNGGLVWLSTRAVRVLENFNDMKTKGQAAILIQKVYRGYITRKQIRSGMNGGNNIPSYDSSAAMIAPPDGDRNETGAMIGQDNNQNVNQVQQQQQQQQDQTADDDSSLRRKDSTGKDSMGGKERDPEREREKAERRKSKVISLKKHLVKISDAYYVIINKNESEQVDPGAPSQQEIDF
ncbi:hypothetical protein HDU76_011862, partial [Blyttiomyces sp. JEL0837]